jgi:hypothetical protein
LWPRRAGTGWASDTIGYVTGNSSRNLNDKLGIRPGTRVIIMRAPAGYLELLPGLADEVNLASRLSGRFDVIQYFAVSEEQLGAVMPNLALHLVPGGMLWVSWAKRTVA